MLNCKTLVKLALHQLHGLEIADKTFCGDDQDCCYTIEPNSDEDVGIVGRNIRQQEIATIESIDCTCKKSGGIVLDTCSRCTQLDRANRYRKLDNWDQCWTDFSWDA